MNFDELIELTGLTQREVICIVSYYVDGFNTVEIGEALGLSRPTISVALTSAKKKLRKHGLPIPQKPKTPKISSFSNDCLDQLVKKTNGTAIWLDNKSHFGDR